MMFYCITIKSYIKEMTPFFTSLRKYYFAGGFIFYQLFLFTGSNYWYTNMYNSLAKPLSIKE